MAEAPPAHILILGSGVFALSTALELLSRPSYSNTKLTLVSPTLPVEASSTSAEDKSTFTAFSTSSHDTTRIVRTDYADPVYAALGAEAHALWRDPASGWAADGRYTESGLVLCADRDAPTAAYVGEALKNARDLERKSGISENQSRVRVVNTPAEIQGVMKASPDAAKGTGDLGYVNYGAGWADAGACTNHALAKLLSHPAAATRLTVHRAAATRLNLSEGDVPAITGATLDRAPHSISADMTILATGAWTPTLLDTRGIASPTAQSSAYIPISEAEYAVLKDVPVHLNLGSGCFFFPPTKKTRRPGGAGTGYEIKIARHAFGYKPPLARARPVRVDPDGEKVVGLAKVPVPVFPANMPPADESLMRAFVARALPLLADVADPASPRPWTARMCYYLDTASGDFLVARHPAFRSSLFVATGGSGHGFKFLPALGRRIVDVLDGTDARARGPWTRKWAWPALEAPLKRGDPGLVVCRDGSRAGEPGQLLEDALAGVRTKVVEAGAREPTNVLEEAFKVQQEVDPSKFTHKSNL